MAWSALAAAPVAAANPLKVVIIVGPTGALTDSYRQTGNAIAGVATAAGADVVKVYSPRATWSRVRTAENAGVSPPPAGRLAGAAALIASSGPGELGRREAGLALEPDAEGVDA